MTTLNLDIIGKETEERIFKYTWKDVILYNLAIGAQPDKELNFVYEGTRGGVKVYPSYACIVAGIGFPKFSKKGIDGLRFIHGEQLIKLYHEFPPQSEIKVKGVCENIYDKGKAAVIHTKMEGRKPDGTLLFETRYVHFYLGEGDFGGDRGPKSEHLTPPEGVEPDFSIFYKTNTNQAALYRLIQDLNPLHIDPEFAKRSGKFTKSILHGLCTFGFATRAIVQGLCEGNVSRFKEFKARFTSEVYPGESIITEGWKVQDHYIIQARTERGAIVLGNAHAIIGD
ncbi:MAG: MaoC/PaaZ C-terminal domain-containing protein [Promethearchaeota archaeon]